MKFDSSWKSCDYLTVYIYISNIDFMSKNNTDIGVVRYLRRYIANEKKLYQAAASL